MASVVIIGSGIAGIAASIRLACAGHEVTVFEQNAYVGGKLTVLNRDGYRFDAGPSLFTLPHLVEELFTLAGEKATDHFSYISLEKGCHYFYEDGTFFRAWHDRSKFADELRNQLGYAQPERVLEYLDQARFRYELTAPLFIENSLHRLGNFLNWQTLKGILYAWRLNLNKSMDEENRAVLKDPRLVQYFNRFATYNGSDPFQAPALLNMIPHLEHTIGTFLPKGGMHAITESLYRLAQRKGVQFKLNSKVERIVTAGKEVQGVTVNGLFHPAHLVVCNADMDPVYRYLLPDIAKPEKLLRQEKSSSAIIFYWGIKKSFPQLDLHNIFFSANYKAEFDAMFKQQTMYEDPTVYVNITSKYEPQDAPSGSENWFVMVNAPNNTGQDWDALIQQTRERILKKLNRLLQTDVQQLIETESVLDPRLIEAKTSSYAGALYGNASNNRFAAFLRHPNASRQVKGLYFCGGSVHPGGGIPLCLNSAKIVAKLVQQDTA